MSGPITERAFWDAGAAALEGARSLVWAEPEALDAWDRRVEECLAAILPHLGTIPVGGTVLDLGCGIGRLAIPAAKWLPHATIVGVDVSGEMLRHAWNAATEAGTRNVRWVQGDGRSLPIIGRLSGAYSVAMFQHIPPEATATYIRLVGMALAPDARFRFQFATTGADAFLSHRLSLAEVEAACVAAGLRVVTVDVGLILPVWTWVTAEKT